MVTYCHIDHTDEPNVYSVRVNELVVESLGIDEKGRESFKSSNGKQLLAFTVTSELKGIKLRRHIEQQAAMKLQE